jgi:hypothetical protein
MSGALAEAFEHPLFSVGCCGGGGGISSLPAVPAGNLAGYACVDWDID